jgi:hypothetical protein
LRLSKAEIINELSGCMALVRPVTMSDDAVTEWLAVAAREVAAMRPSAFRAACGDARRKCTHHGQIVPEILNGKTARGWREIGSSAFLPSPSNDSAKLASGHREQKLIESAARACKP